MHPPTSPSQTTDTGDVAAFERTVRFWPELQERLSTHRERFRWGTAYLDLDFPDRYDGNHLWLDAPAPDATAEDLVGEADRILGGAGLRHRKVMVAREHEGTGWAMGFAERGYRVSRLVTMALRAGSADPVDTANVEIVDFATVRPAIESVNAREHGLSDDVARQLTDYDGKLEHELGCRFYVVRADDAIAAYCQLYAMDGVAQVEDVNTLEGFRGRGFAKAVVTAAARDGLAEGNELVFLYADGDDWPQGLYERLGFRTVGRGLEFTLEPAGRDSAT